MRLRLFAAVVAGTTAVFSTPVQAQTRFDFTPHLGMYFPMEAAVRQPSQDLIMRQLMAVVLGGRFAMHASKHVVFEGTVDFSPSPVATTQNSRTFDTNAGILMASVRSVFKFGPWKPKTPELQLATGVGLVNRFGNAWRDHTGTTDPAAVLGVGGRYPMGNWLPLTVRFELESYISRVQFGPASGGVTDKRLNYDTVWSIGFELPLNGPEHP